ncbi:MAG: HAD hydrolase-like protein [Myxococcota bacterium]
MKRGGLFDGREPAPTVYLFDIDGTIVTSGDGLGRTAMLTALGPHAAGANFSFGGMTDRAIVRRARVQAGAPADEASIDDILERYLHALARALAAGRPSALQVHPGVVAVLDAIEQAPTVAAVGLGTGNVERGARLKLDAVSLDDRFPFGGFGCDAEPRDALIRIGAERGAARLGRARSDCRVVVIGDTPRDIAAAHAVGAEAVAVATGGFGRDELERHQPEFVFDDLTDAGVLPALLPASASA